MSSVQALVAMTHTSRALKKMTAALLLPLALFAGSALAVDLMSCRAMGVVRSSCCCPAPAARAFFDEHPRLEQGCCERVTWEVGSEAPGPSAPLPLVPFTLPHAAEPPFLAPVLVELTQASAPSAERTCNATGPPIRVLHCSYLT